MPPFAKPCVTQVCPFSAVPSQTSLPSRTLLPQVWPVHALVLNVHVPEHVSVPPLKPRVMQVCPFKSVPSHSSGLSSRLSPQSVQAFSLKPRQFAAQPSVPPSCPRVMQVCPPRFPPSQSSGPSRPLLPQTWQPVVSSAQPLVQTSVPIPRPIDV